MKVVTSYEVYLGPSSSVGSDKSDDDPLDLELHKNSQFASILDWQSLYPDLLIIGFSLAICKYPKIKMVLF